MVRCGSKNGHLKRHEFNKNWTMFSIFVNHSRLNNQHKWILLYFIFLFFGRGLYNHIMISRIITLTIYKINI